MSPLVPWVTFGAWTVLVGLVLGSFLNVVILRLPRDQSLVPRSACPRCGHPVRPHDLVPVISWLLLRGRCRDCGTSISPRYPLIEALGGMLALLTYVRFVPEAEALDLAHGAAWLVYFAFLCLLVVVVYVDVRHNLILDETSIFAVPAGVAGVALLEVLGYEGWMAMSWKASVLGAALWGGLFWVIFKVLAYAWRRDALGLGDVKLLAMLGAFLGAAPGTFTALLVGSLVGSVVGIAVMILQRRRVTLPMGPPLAFGAAVYVLFGDVLLQSLFPGMVHWPELIAWWLR